MKPTLIRVLTLLREKKNKGISFHDFGKGFALPKRASELIQMGYVISRELQYDKKDYRYTKYTLLSEPK